MGTVRMKEPSEEMMKIAMPNTNSGRTSIGMEKTIGEYFFISLEKLIPFKNQARRNFNESELENLALSIIEYGIRQPLTIVRSLENEDKFEIVSGERRARAAKMAGIETVPCIIISDYSKAEAIAIVENIHRSDLHPVELAKAYNSLLSNGSFSSGADAAASIGISKSAFYEVLKILKLPESVQDGLMKYEIRSRDKIRLLLKSSDPQKTFDDMITPKTGSGYCRSILRVALENGEFLIQKEAINSLKSIDKERLRIILEHIIADL